MISFNLNYFLRGPISTDSHTDGVIASTCEFGGDTNNESILGGIYIMVEGLMAYNYITSDVSTVDNSESLSVYLGIFFPIII